jgi:dipeptidyl aminopeptidase/acylaminoacyl peptidase
LDGRGGCDISDHPRGSVTFGDRLVARRQTGLVHDAHGRSEQLADQDAEAPAGAKWTETPRIVERLNYRRDRAASRTTATATSSWCPPPGGTPRQLTSGDFDHNGSEWTPDGRSILFSGLRGEDAEYQWRESEIYAVDVADGKVRQLTNRKGQDSSPTISPDGKRVAYTGNDWSTDTWRDSKIYLMNMDGSNPRLISGDWDRSPSGIRWNADGTGLYFTAQNEGSQNLYFLPLSANGKVAAHHDRHPHDFGLGHLAKGVAVGTLTSFHKLGEHHQLRRQDAVCYQATHRRQRDVLTGRKLGDVKERSQYRRSTV